MYRTDPFGVGDPRICFRRHRAAKKPRPHAARRRWAIASCVPPKVRALGCHKIGFESHSQWHVFRENGEHDDNPFSNPLKLWGKLVSEKTNWQFVFVEEHQQMGNSICKWGFNPAMSVLSRSCAKPKISLAHEDSEFFMCDPP